MCSAWLACEHAVFAGMPLQHGRCGALLYKTCVCQILVASFLLQMQPANLIDADDSAQLGDVGIDGIYYGGQ